PSYNYVWHADPQHPAEYWTLGINGTEELDADAYEAAITDTNNGLYIARDVRYTPNTLDFNTSNTARKDEDTEYVVYYDTSSSAVAEAIAALGTTYGSAYSTDKYIFATLPMQMGGMGGGGTFPGGGTMPSGDIPGGGGMPSGDMPGTPPGGFTRMPVMVAAASESSIAAMSTMTHSASDAYNNPVLHITEPGTYRISGEWHGQIWVEAGAKAKHKVTLILNGVEVSCDVAPAIVFYKVYKWAEDNGYDDQSTLTANDLWKTLSDEMVSSDGSYQVGAIVEIADGTTNTFTGANTYRILELSPKLDDDTDLPKYDASEIGSNISAQQKMYKLDGAFHSRRTIVIGGGSAGTGTLNITSTTCEGLDSEMHMLIDGGVITVSAPDDGINVNEDNVSVFTMNSGTLNVSSTNADGIDSNGWIAFNGGTLSIVAGSQRQNSAGEAGIDAENGVYIYDSNAYTWTAASGSGGNVPVNPTSPDVPVNPTSPDVPVIPTSPDVPVNPTSPDVPVIPTSPDVPVNPTSPDVPVRPTSPDVPINPTSPDVPVIPTSPDVPVRPTSPDVPVIPTSPDVPVRPTSPDVPVNPTSPDVPVNPTSPDVPVIPTSPDAHYTPTVPDAPSTSTTLTKPTVSVEEVSDTVRELLDLANAVVVELPSSSSGTSRTVSDIPSSQLSAIEAQGREVALVLPEITVTTAAINVFGVSLDNLAPGTVIFLDMTMRAATASNAQVMPSVSAAEDYTDKYTFLDDDGNEVYAVPSNRHVNAAAYLEPSYVYSPVITTSGNSSEPTGVGSSSGGCSTGFSAAILIAGLALLRRKK
ncbi:MAG: carbohydrate-binding domain-containing protein, partial [Synergistaceae bacterium]|nr:carbohydrate-binding domain-containing protein [Synergistaceae bacterium]